MPVVPEILRSKVALLEGEHATALADRDARKDEFLAMLAHELRNPIAPISNAAEALSRWWRRKRRVRWLR